jgi:hypothetical protein
LGEGDKKTGAEVKKEGRQFTNHNRHTILNAAIAIRHKMFIDF